LLSVCKLLNKDQIAIVIQVAKNMVK